MESLQTIESFRSFEAIDLCKLNISEFRGSGSGQPYHRDVSEHGQKQICKFENRGSGSGQPYRRV